MNSAAGLPPGARDKKECELRLRALMATDEAVLAVGTAEELRELTADLGSGGGWTFVVVTDRRILFGRWGSPHENHDEIELDAITGWADGSQYNAYALVLMHPPKTRGEHVPEHRFLWFRWGNASAPVTRSRTIFRFSRNDTQVARAIRNSLEQRGLRAEVLQFEEAPREQRVSASEVIHRRR